MNDFRNIRNKKLCEILAIIKIIYILLGMVAMISSYMTLKSCNYIVFCTYVVSIMILLIIYFIWLSNIKFEFIDYKARYRDNIETILLILICTVIILATGKQESPYKFLYIFAIIISAIQFGKKYTMIVSVICSILVCGVDIFSIELSTYLKSTTKELITNYFQIDIVIASAFFVTSWILGMYVNIEKEHSKELQKLANLDELTGLYNHRCFQESLEKIMKREVNNNGQISLLFMDIDYFKMYNDLNGHQAGDVVLRKVGNILKENIREYDIAARYGGEEFAIILPNTSEKEAIVIGERIRKSIEDTYFSGQENQPNKNVTISIGVSSYPLRAKNKHRFINTADDALYRAKSLGRNRVSIYYSVLEEISEYIFIDKEVANSLKRLINKIDKKDKYTYGHTERMVIYLGWFSNYLNLNKEDNFRLKLAAYLHDIGKIEISEEVLNKKEKLTEVEYEILKKHPQIGVDLIKHIKVFEDLLPIIRHHHERYDGMGYPDKLKGESIPYLARLISIVDYFDIIMSHKGYDTKKSFKEAIIELRKNSGSKFDPELVEKFTNMMELKYN